MIFKFTILFLISSFIDVTSKSTNVKAKEPLQNDLSLISCEVCQLSISAIYDQIKYIRDKSINRKVEELEIEEILDGGQ